MFRFIDTGGNEGAMNMAIDEALLMCQEKFKLPPAIRVYRFVPPTVSIGYFQSMTKEIDLKSCNKLGFGYIRRPTGGRAVLHDKELTYSVTIAHPHKITKMSLLDSFIFISNGIIKAIKILGSDASYSQTDDKEVFSPSCFSHPTFSDITINGKKVVGSAQMRNKIGLLQHGSILYHVSIEDIFSCFNIDEEKRRKGIELSKKRITSLSDELGQEIGFEDIKTALKKGMEEVLQEKIIETVLTPEEIELSQNLYENKYNTYAWNFMR